jgi:ZIP family zinc transporter
MSTNSAATFSPAIFSGRNLALRWLGWGITALGAGFAVRDSLFAARRVVEAHPWLADAFFAALVAGAATGIGGLLAVAMPRLIARYQDQALAGAAGIMMAAALVSLLPPAFSAADAQWGPAMGFFMVLIGMVAGMIAIRSLDVAIPHLHPGSHRMAPAAKRMALLVAAVSLHNIPEGLAVGAAHGAGGDAGSAAAWAIGLQNVPEGWVVGAGALALGATPLTAALLALASGLVEPVAAAAGGLAVASSTALLPLSLALAAGAMIWVSGHELAEARRSGAMAGRYSLAAGGFLGMAWLVHAF